jgi:hypothetical protein
MFHRSVAMVSCLNGSMISICPILMPVALQFACVTAAVSSTELFFGSSPAVLEKGRDHYEF